jgi:hypothetical protein
MTMVHATSLECIQSLTERLDAAGTCNAPPVNSA